MRVKLSERYAHFDTKVPDILSWARGGVINMAGGIPDPSTILPPEIVDIAMEVVKQRGASAFQYGDSQGLPELREEIVRLKGFGGDPSGVVVTVGSQEGGLDLIGKTFLAPMTPSPWRTQRTSWPSQRSRHTRPASFQYL